MPKAGRKLLPGLCVSPEELGSRPPQLLRKPMSKQSNNLCLCCSTQSNPREHSTLPPGGVKGWVGTPSHHPCWLHAKGLGGPGRGDGLSPRLRETKTKDSILANSPSPGSGARPFYAHVQGMAQPTPT